MEAVIKLSADEFDNKIFEQIKALINSSKNLEVTISISEVDNGILRTETNKEYTQRILKARQELSSNKNAVTFQLNEFDEFQKFLMNEP
jgi:hypothetical protein